MISFGPKDLLKIKAKFEQTIKGNSKNALLASRKPYIAYQLGLQFQVIPLADSFNELIKQLKEKNVKFLYWGSDESNSRRNIKFPVSTDSLKNYGLEILLNLMTSQSSMVLGGIHYIKTFLLKVIITNFPDHFS